METTIKTIENIGQSVASYNLCFPFPHKLTQKDIFFFFIWILFYTNNFRNEIFKSFSPKFLYLFAVYWKGDLAHGF